jgi:hypothetical protein
MNLLIIYASLAVGGAIGFLTFALIAIAKQADKI